MEKECLVDSLADLLQIPERWMIQDDEKNLHELSEGIKGIPVLVSARNEIYRLYFGKERITGEHFRRLDEVHTSLMRFIWENFTYKIKSDIQDELAAIIEKYNLKRINKRGKKSKS